LYNTGKMPASDPYQEFPSESAATFEQAKKAADAKDVAKQRTEETDKTESQNTDSDIDTTYPSEHADDKPADETKSDADKSDDNGSDSSHSDDSNENVDNNNDNDDNNKDN